MATQVIEDTLVVNSPTKPSDVGPWMEDRQPDALDDGSLGDLDGTELEDADIDDELTDCMLSQQLEARINQKVLLYPHACKHHMLYATQIPKLFMYIYL